MRLRQVPRKQWCHHSQWSISRRTENQRLSRLSNLHPKTVSKNGFDKVVFILNEQSYDEIKQKYYGNRIVLFAPLYLSNYCNSKCVYCGFQKGNKIARAQLSEDEIHEEDFERAAQLREEIHKLEEAHKEAEASKKDDKNRN